MVLGVLTAACLLLGPRGASAEPSTEETPTSPDSAKTVTSQRGIVAADHPLASEVGARALKRGGNAVDAGIATLLALGVVNPMSSGLGGGGFCLWRSADDGDVDVVDFREVAPKKASRNMYVQDGEVQESWMIRGGKAVGVPGEPAGLWAMSHKWGALDWEEVVTPALELARDGYEVRSELAERLHKVEDELQKRSDLADVFRSDDAWIDAGTTLERPNLAKLLRRLRDEGIAPYYRGAIADDIVDAVQGADGIIAKEDLRTYAIQMRDPVAGDYRGYRVFSMPPSSSGGTAIIETLNILEEYDLAKYGRSAQGIHYVVEALKHAFADRAGWLGDTDFVDVPIDRLTSESYAAELRDTIKPQSVLDPEEYGSKAPMPDKPGTTHLSIVDGDQNMLSCTSTINLSFGSMVYVPEWGLVLNDEMGDFTPKPGEPNNYGLVGTEQNAVAPGKRPLSSMSPTLVLNPDGKPFMAVGASGGPTIITGTLFAFLNTVDFEMGPEEAITAPRIHHQWLPYTLYLEEPLQIKTGLEEFGHEVEVRPAYSNTQMIVRTDDGAFTGVSDPRKSGAPAASENVSDGASSTSATESTSE